jgi:hypothetical protein
MRLLRRGIGLRMARPHRDVAECQRLQDPSDTALIHRHEEAGQDPIAQIAQSPAHDAIFGDIRPLADPSCELRLFLDRQLRPRPTAVRAVRQASDALLVVTDHPVAQRLPIHAAVPGSLPPTMTLQHQGERQKPSRDRRLGSTRRVLSEAVRIVLQSRDLHRHRRSTPIQNGQNQSHRHEPTKIT